MYAPGGASTAHGKREGPVVPAALTPDTSDRVVAVVFVEIGLVVVRYATAGLSSAGGGPTARVAPVLCPLLPVELAEPARGIVTDTVEWGQYVGGAA
jgi:hypothetical protein